jgi:hypothetical protein
MPVIATPDSWLPAATAAGALGPGLIWLLYRIVGVIELWIIMRSLPGPDRVAAAVAYIGAHPSRAHIRHGAACQCHIAVSVETTESQDANGTNATICATSTLVEQVSGDLECPIPSSSALGR